MDLNEIKRLIQLVKKSGIGELEVTEGGRTIRISAAPVVVSGPAQSAVAAAPAPAPVAAPASAAVAA
ncbi:MAG: acetyl-CoA carboxylase biotin carboxyl carrier protein, partial [Candidatus Eisenbacteria bacterium]